MKLLLRAATIGHVVRHREDRHDLAGLRRFRNELRTEEAATIGRLDGILDVQGPTRRQDVADACIPCLDDLGRSAGLGERPADVVRGDAARDTSPRRVHVDVAVLSVHARDQLGRVFREPAVVELDELELARCRGRLGAEPLRFLDRVSCLLTLSSERLGEGAQPTGEVRHSVAAPTGRDQGRDRDERKEDRCHDKSDRRSDCVRARQNE